MPSSRILVVDDSLTIRRALEFILKPQGYALDFAADGREALARAASATPDLVLLDYVLPDMRGPDVCAALASTPTTANTPVILVSAKGASIREAYQHARNVVSYITKPFKPQVVTAIVANALARSALSTDSPPVTRAVAPVPSVGRASHHEAAAFYEEPKTPLRLGTQSVEEAFAALLEQLEDAFTTDELATGQAAPSGEVLASLAVPGSVVACLERVLAGTGEVGQHLRGSTLLPYRLRSDGSLAHLTATLLKVHRTLCSAVLALAAAGVPGASLNAAPRVVAACPAGDPLLADLTAALRNVAATPPPLLIERDFVQLAHLSRLLGPACVVVVPGVSSELDREVRGLAHGDTPPRIVALLAPGQELGEDRALYHTVVDRVENLADLLGELLLEPRPSAVSAEDVLEIVSL
jgi:CheY-like chemotaxis protein